MDANNKRLTALRIVIAEKCGATWKFTYKPTSIGDQLTEQQVLTFRDRYHRMLDEAMAGPKIIGRDVHNYPISLDAMHEAENMMTYQQQVNYALLLHDNSSRTPSDYLGRDFDVLHTTALQRAEAFVTACGLTERVKEIEKDL